MMVTMPILLLFFRKDLAYLHDLAEDGGNPCRRVPCLPGRAGEVCVQHSAARVRQCLL